MDTSFLAMDFIGWLRERNPDLPLVLAVAADEGRLSSVWRAVAAEGALLHVVETELEARIALTHATYDLAILDVASLPFAGRFFLPWAAREARCSCVFCFGQPAVCPDPFDGLAVEAVGGPFAVRDLVERVTELLRLR